MTPKTKIILIGIGIGLIIIAGIGFGVWREKRQTKINANPSTANVNDDSTTPRGDAPVETSVVTGAATRSGSLDAYSTARVVAERFASFSSEARYGNVESLYPFFTPDFLDWAKTYVRDGRAKAASAQSYRVESRVVSVVSETIADTQANFVLQLQKAETTGTTPTVVSYRNLQIDMIKSDQQWLIDRLKWE